MSQSIHCEECGQHFTVEDEKAGQKYECTTCGATFVVPEQHLEFDLIGSYQIWDAKRLLPQLEKAKIRFQIETSATDGDFTLYVWTADKETFLKIHKECFGR